MSSGIIFNEKNFDCSNGMAEYILDLCISEFKNTPDHEKNNSVLEFFQDYRELFFSGMIIIIGRNDFTQRGEYEFLSVLLDRVFSICISETSELTDLGKAKISKYFVDLPEEIRVFASEM